MTDIDLTRFVINRRRIIRWRVKTLKSNKCGLTKWIQSGGNLTRLVNFLWPLARGVPSDTKETTRRAKATSVFSISRSTFVRAIQRTTKNNEYSAHSIRRGAATMLERHKNGSHTTPTWACRRTNNSDVRKPISSAARIASQHSSHTGASRTVNADTHICNQRVHDVPSPFDPGGSGDEFALIWDPSFGEGQWLNGCASFNHIIAPHSSVHAPLLCNEDDFPAEPLSIRGHFVSTSQSDNITWKITGGGIKLKTHTLAVDWPLDIISSNALDVDRIAANATQKERAIIVVIRNEASFLSVLTSHTDSFVRRSKLTGDDCALLESADTIESGDVETWCAAFKVAKKKKLSRLVIDATPLNRCCKRPPPMPLVSMDTFVRECFRAKFIATIDLRSFFYQIVVPSFMRKHFGICINKARGRGQRVRLKRLCMGWTWSPCIAQSIANIVARTARSRASFQDHVFLEPWLDNFVLCAQNETDFNVLKSSLIVVLREFSVEAHKFESGFEEPILGLMYRPDHTAQHPADFLSKAFCSLNKASHTTLSFAQAAGFAIWILLVRNLPTACIPGTISVLRKIAKVVINPKMWEDTIELDSRTYNELEMIKDIALTSITRADTDATETTIAICCGAFSSAKSVPFHHIFQNELDAALWAVREAAKRNFVLPVVLVHVAAGFFFLRRLFCSLARRWRSARLASTRAAVCLELQARMLRLSWLLHFLTLCFACCSTVSTLSSSD